MSRLFSTRVLPVRPRSGKTSKSYICPQLHDGGCDGELLVGEDDEGEDQEQWKTRLRPPEKYDDQDEGDP